MKRKAADLASSGQDSRAAEVATRREAAPAPGTASSGSPPGAGGLPDMKLKLFLWAAGWVVLGIIGAAAPLSAQQLFKTERTIIYYTAPQDLLEMNRRLHTLKVAPSAAPANSEDAVLARLAAKIDGLFARVCQILRLSPENLPPVRLFLLQNGQEVRERQLVLQSAGQRGFFGYGSLEAFYEARSRAIFLSLRHLDPGILAHELTHFLLCTAVPGPPSRPVQENWAQYVETQVR
jgi:hypothetical protein